MRAQPGDFVRGPDVTGLRVAGRVIDRHQVNAPVGPFSSGTVVVVEVTDRPTPLVALVREYEITDVERQAP